MDYEKAYKEALNRAKLLKYNPQKVLFECENIPVSDYIFPELKESKSDRIKKVLVDYFKRYKGQEERGGSMMFCGIPTDDILEWIEKQDKSAEINPDEIIEECHQDNADHIIDIVTEQRKPAEWSNPYSGVSFVYNNHTWGMCARDNGVEILIDSEIKAFISPEKSFIYPTPLHHNGTSKARLAIEAIREEAVDNTNKPKFHEGDTIVEKDFFECDYEVIKEIKDGKYIFTDGSTLNIDEQDGWLLVKPPK